MGWKELLKNPYWERCHIALVKYELLQVERAILTGRNKDESRDLTHEEVELLRARREDLINFMNAPYKIVEMYDDERKTEEQGKKIPFTFPGDPYYTQEEIEQKFNQKERR